MPTDISISPHKIRHTFATMCLKNNANLVFIQEVLGHSSIQVTKKYLHLNKDDLKEEHNNVSPISLFKKKRNI